MTPWVFGAPTTTLGEKHTWPALLLFSPLPHMFVLSGWAPAVGWTQWSLLCARESLWAPWAEGGQTSRRRQIPDLPVGLPTQCSAWTRASGVGRRLGVHHQDLISDSDSHVSALLDCYVNTFGLSVRGVGDFCWFLRRTVLGMMITKGKALQGYLLVFCFYPLECSVNMVITWDIFIHKQYVVA